MTCLCLKRAVMVLYALAGTGFAADSGDRLSFSLLSARHREPFQMEIPADIDLNREEKIILLNDSRLGGVEATYLQLLTGSGAFVAGPHLPRGSVCDLRVIELDRTARSAAGPSAEIIVGLRDPLGVEVISGAMRLIAFSPLDTWIDDASVSLRIEGAVDGDGIPPDELLVSLTPDGPGASTLLCVEWMTGSLRWLRKLPGRLMHPASLWTREADTHVVVACVDSMGATLVVLASDGSELRRVNLATFPVAEIGLDIVDDYLGPPCLAVLAVPVDTAASPPTLSILDDLGSSLRGGLPLPGARGIIAACQIGGATRIVCASGGGDLLVCDTAPRIVSRYPAASGLVTLCAVDDLDLDGEPEAVLRLGDGHTACASLTDGQVVRLAGSDEIRLLRNGFGAAPRLVTRDGGQYRSWRIHRSGSSGGAVGLSPWFAAALLAALALATATLVDRVTRAITRRRVFRGLVDVETAVAVTDAGGRLRWANRAMRNLLGDGPIRRGVGMDALLFQAGFARKSESSKAGYPREQQLVRDGRPYRVGSSVSPGLYPLRASRLVCVEECPGGPGSGGGDSWAPVAREITVLMRDSLSTVRLGVQRLRIRQDSPGGLSSPDTSLRRVAGEVSRLAALCRRLAELAAVSRTEATQLTSTEVLEGFHAGLEKAIREKIRISHGASALRFFAKERQIIYALTAIAEALIASGASAVEVSAGQAAPDGAVFLLHPVPRDSQITIARFARLVAQAVMRSHGGSVVVEAEASEPFVSLAFRTEKPS